MASIAFPLPGPSTSPDQGRRLYIAKFSLQCVAMSDAGLARQVCHVLSGVRIAKAVHHHIVEQGLELGLVSDDVAKDLAADYERAWKHSLTELLASMGHRPSVPRDRSLFSPLLEPGERIVASCSDQGYFTFATGEASARRMFGDHEPLADLQRALASGAGPADLVMIKGRSLAPIDPELGVGRVGAMYARRLGFAVLEQSELEELDRAACARALAEFRDRIVTLWPYLSTDERQVCRHLLGALGRSLESIGSLQ